MKMKKKKEDSDKHPERKTDIISNNDTDRHCSRFLFIRMEQRMDGCNQLC